MKSMLQYKMHRKEDAQKCIAGELNINKFGLIHRIIIASN